jgi:DNA polymerase-3 subunit delta
MKLSVSKSAAFIERPDKSLRLVLLYGPDVGLAHERGAALAKQFVSDLTDPFAVAELGADTLHGDLARLADEMATIPMLGGWRLCRVRDASDSAFAAVDALLNNPPKGNCIAILEAGDLDKRSKLRLRVEDDPHAMAVPCYAEEGFALDKSVHAMLRGEGFTIDSDALAALTALLPPDRAGVRMEVDKLITSCWKNAGKKIAMADVTAILSDGSAEDVDEAVWAAASFDLAKLDATLARLNAEGVQPTQLLRAMQRHILKLYEARAQMEDGRSMEEALKQLRPPVFFKRETQIKKQLQRWTLPALDRALAALVTAEAQCKSSGLPTERIGERALLGLGRALACT